MTLNSYRSLQADHFRQACQKAGLGIRGLNMQGLLLLRQLSHQPIRRKGRNETGHAHPSCMGALVKLQGARFNAATNHYEITGHGRHALRLFEAKGLIALAEQLTQRIAEFGKEVAA